MRRLDLNGTVPPGDIAYYLAIIAARGRNGRLAERYLKLSKWEGRKIPSDNAIAYVYRTLEQSMGG